MKTYTYCTPSHLELLNNWLIQSLPDDLDLNVVHGEQECMSAAYHRQGWNECMQNKVKICIQACEETRGDAFLHLDTDIQFFGRVESILREHLEQFDIVAQDDTRDGRSEITLCGGFFACQSTEIVRSFWNEVLMAMQQNSSIDDQVAFNNVAQNSDLRIKALHKDMFWCPRGEWNPGELLTPPKNILMHHANWTKGVKNKLIQLDVIRKHVEDRLAGSR